MQRRRYWTIGKLWFSRMLQNGQSPQASHAAPRPNGMQTGRHICMHEPLFKQGSACANIAARVSCICIKPSEPPSVLVMWNPDANFNAYYDKDALGVEYIKRLGTRNLEQEGYEPWKLFPPQHGRQSSGTHGRRTGPDFSRTLIRSGSGTDAFSYAISDSWRPPSARHTVRFPPSIEQAKPCRSRTSTPMWAYAAHGSMSQYGGRLHHTTMAFEMPLPASGYVRFVLLDFYISSKTGYCYRNRVPRRCRAPEAILVSQRAFPYLTSVAAIRFMSPACMIQQRNGQRLRVLPTCQRRLPFESSSSVPSATVRVLEQ
ncbi:uncharacterized protein EI97DRAFT_236421 [Westerdykella ornata]|uniref:Uncharacterized protein n=1 Tax=Westerdykella ornata TaxID=318751 RepID=A0A6A6J790_WESOR|nr:uncharacterized protein EI97DRAFT_236421 [Westerdykella ornata]KAF2272094.1 hypothetical protein EI97DRAFT_236421 [Westerdykella ornata]